LSSEQREELERWAQSRALPAGDVFRARLILALADGLSYREIERGLGASAPTVSKWKSRFEESGLAGLHGQHQGSKPRTATPAAQARIIRRAQQKPADGSTHWSCRKLARELGISKTTVQRVLAQAKLRPHRLDRYMASNDPDFEQKAADIIGLYMNPVWSRNPYTLKTRGISSGPRTAVNQTILDHCCNRIPFSKPLEKTTAESERGLQAQSGSRGFRVRRAVPLPIDRSPTRRRD
jgi:transposase